MGGEAVSGWGEMGECVLVAALRVRQETDSDSEKRQRTELE